MKKNIGIDQYIAAFPKDVQKVLEQIRLHIKQIVPQAEEKLSYGIPTFTLNGNLVHFGGFKNHIGFYPTSSGIKAFEKELAAYKHSKGAVQFPLDKDMPFDLITRIVQFRINESKNKSPKEKAKSKEVIFSMLAAPAQRALANNGITTIKQLAALTEKEVLSFQGMGPGSIPKLRKVLEAEGLGFRK